MRQHFRAPRSTKLRVTTVVFMAICLVAMYAVKGWASLLILAIVLFAAAMTVRGYSVLDGKLLIHRLGWATKFDLAGLSSVEASPGATMGSVRTLGIGGLFGFVGHFRNEALGAYRAYATNEPNTVVMDFAGDTIVVTPEDPQEFVATAQAAHAELMLRLANESGQVTGE